MGRLVLKNIGPIKSVDITLNKINVIIGPQSSGKSTIAKIISYCSWMEKKNGTNRKGMIRELETFHRMNGYFTEQSAILYEGENITFAYHPRNLEALPDCLKGEKEEVDECLVYSNNKTINPKVAYIPAERNFVSALSNARKYAEEDDNLRNFIEDWLDAKRHYSTNKSMELMDMGVKYYYDEKTNCDFLLQEGTAPFLLERASSGLQSLVPLMVLVSWFSSGIYEQNKPFSPEESIKMKEILTKLTQNQVEDSEQQVLLERFKNFMSGKVYTHTQFVVEEPEQNLFPKTQVEFLYFLLSMVNHGRPHRLVLTTHSPYILYALNNCLLAHLVKGQLDSETCGQVAAVNFAVCPESVSVWQIEGGILCNEKGEENHTIQDAKGLIRKNYFNRIMKQVMGDFNELLNYYE